MKPLEFHFKVSPLSWKRTNQWRGRKLTDKKMREYQKHLKLIARMQYKGEPLDRALSISAVFGFQRPKKPKWGYPMMGDVDNYLKNICDSLEGVVWVNDRFIVDKHGRKEYWDEPGIRLSVRVL